MLRGPSRAVPALSHRSLRPDLVGPVQQHTSLIVDGSQGGTGQGTI